METHSARRSVPTLSVIHRHCGAARWSHQMMHGRMTDRSASRKTDPCICPESPTPEIEPASTPLEAISWLIALVEAYHQLSGSCSAQPGYGVAVL